MCEDYPSLDDRQISKIRFEFPSWLGRLKLGDSREFVLNEEHGGGVISLRNLDDPSKYLSAEFAAIGVDELTRNEVGIFNFLRMRLRWPGVDRPLFGGATNPGGKGHQWVKDYWITKKFPPEFHEQGLAKEFHFIQALPSENPHLSEQYYKDLATLPEKMRTAYLKGRWDILAGTYFDCFSEARHVQQIELKPWWPRWVSVDWGYQHPACAHWHAMDEASHVHTYRELHGSGIGEEELGRRIGGLSIGENVKAIFLSPDAFAKRGAQNTVAQQIDEGLRPFKMPSPAQADNDRIGGARLMYQMLDADYWTIDPSCVNLIECLPTLIHDEDNSEDVLKVDADEGQLGDDAYDSARYGLKSMLSAARTPWTEVLKAKVQTVAEPTQRAIYAQRLVVEHDRMAGRDGNPGYGRMRWMRQ